LTGTPGAARTKGKVWQRRRPRCGGQGKREKVLSAEKKVKEVLGVTLRYEAQYFDLADLCREDCKARPFRECSRPTSI